MTLHVRSAGKDGHADLIAMRDMLQRAQWHICPCCGEDLPLVWTIRPEWRPSFDHVWPLSRGGRDALGNLVVVHQGCNEKKGNRYPNGCELIWLDAVNARVMGDPVREHMQRHRGVLGGC